MPVHLPPISFNECLDKANERSDNTAPLPKKHLILGNGFSIALFPNIFSYTSLASRVQSPQITNLFSQLNTKDFEYIMRILNDALKVVKTYQNNIPMANQIEGSLVDLRNSLIQVISQSHPDDPSTITEEQYESCRLFLANFESGNKYTFNYDLLLYWVYMKFLFITGKKLEHGDGFSSSEAGAPLIWRDNPVIPQNIYYLHGAIHLFNNGGILEKLSWANNGTPIKNQVCDSISTATYPMFISEGTKDHKVLRIDASTYLNHAFRSLDDIKDNLFIFGHSLGDEDDHVFNRVNSQSDLRNIFISIHGDINSGDNQRIVNKVSGWERLNSNKHYYFYDAADANVWGTP